MTERDLIIEDLLWAVFADVWPISNKQWNDAKEALENIVYTGDEDDS